MMALIIAALFSILAYSQPTNVPVTSSGTQSETAITVDPNNPNHLMATWTDFINYTQYHGYSFSSNGGQSWSPPDSIPGENGYDPSCAIDLSGREYYAYKDGSNVIRISYSTNDGSDWSIAQKVCSQSSNQDKPYIAVDNTGHYNRVYVAWADLTTNPNNAIDFAYADASGNLQTWKQITLDNLSGASPIPSGSQASPLAPGGPRLQGAIPA